MIDARAAACFAEPLLDLGERDAALRGILAPVSQAGARPRGVTAQFLEHAADYHARYANVAHFRVLLDDALARLDPPLAPSTILDIGSGSGNSVLPLLDRFADAFVVATDISPQLLAILRDHLQAEPRYANRYALVCQDACVARYCADAFDLAVGAAILHHVPEPERVIQGCEHALRAGGAAIFFEPFELGHAVLHAAYRGVIDEAQRRGDQAPGFAMLRQLQQDYAMRQMDRTDPRFLELDDKWMFDPAFFEDLARHGRWDECIVAPTQGTQSPLCEQTRVNLRLGMSLPADALPAWAWDRLRDVEAAFSPAARRALLFEGAVVMRTSSAPRGPSAMRAGWCYEPSAPGRGFFVELDGETARVIGCHYDADGHPVWHVAGPARLDGGVMRAPARLMPLASNGTVENERMLILRTTSDDRVLVEWGGGSIELQAQHPRSAGWTGEHATGIGGSWTEDSQAPSFALVIEDLDSRIFAAALLPDAWCMTVATRRHADVFAGEWLVFEGGQSLGGPHRAPGAPRKLGAARILRTTSDRLVVQAPGGEERRLRRGSP